MRKVAIYTRVSQKTQNVTRQLEELREIAICNDFKVVEEYADEGVSGITKERPFLNKMIQDGLAGKFDTVMVLELSRLGRSVRHMCEITGILKSKNIHLYCVNQNIDTSTIVGELFFNIINSISQYERDLIRERTLSGLANAKRKGVKLGRKSNINTSLIQSVKLLRNKGMGIRKIAKELKIGVGSVYSCMNRTSLS